MSLDEDDKRGTSCTVGEDINCYSHYKNSLKPPEKL